MTVKTGNFDGQDVKGDIFVDQHGQFGGIVTALSYRGDLSLCLVLPRLQDLLGLHLDYKEILLLVSPLDCTR